MRVMLEKGAYLPTRSHVTDAGLDLYSREEKVVLPRNLAYTDLASGKTMLTPMGELFDTGVHIEIPEGYFGKIESRSGLNVKASIVSCGGVIDCGYTGPIIVKLYNLGKEPYIVHAGDRIAQLIIMPYYLEDGLEIVDELGETERGNAGIGSTGK